jgi:protein-disulfide isomerase
MSRASRRKARRGKSAKRAVEESRPTQAPSPVPSPSPSPQSLGALVSLAALSALWALFQWTELVRARSGGDSFCPFGQDSSCEQLWDSPAASAVQAWTGLPVAAWGLVWSLVAFALPLWTLVWHDRRSASDRAWPAALLTGLAGGVAVLVLLAGLLIHGAFCSTCVLSYLLAGAYLAIGLLQTPVPWASLTRGAPVAAGGVALAFALLLYPGLHTPSSPLARGHAGLEQIEPRGAEVSRPLVSRRDKEIANVIENLSPQLEQDFADSLARYAQSPRLPMRPSRALVGEAEAPVRITEFIDTLCGHCATMHDVMSELEQRLPPGAFSIESRHFPLDSSCNPVLDRESTAPVRCFSAKAQICLEGGPSAFEFTRSLFGNRHSLDRQRVLELAEPFMPREQLEACIASPETATRLAEDIDWALEHDIQGTPLILLNGRKVDSLGPLLYALILTQGESASPAFDALPAPGPGWKPTWR